VRLNGRVLFAAAGMVAGSAAAQTPGGWVHIQVEEPQKASRVHVNLPFAVVEAALKAAPETVVSSGHIHLGLSSHDELSIADVRRIWEAVRNAGDADFVTVEHGEQNVKVARHGDLVEIHVEQPGQPLHIGRGIEAHRAAMMRKRPALPAALDRFDRHHFQRAQIGIAGVVEQHRNVLVELRRQIEAGADVGGRIVASQLDPRNAADHVGAERHRLMH